MITNQSKNPMKITFPKDKNFSIPAWNIEDKEEFTHFVKGDVSGIQDFIFDVKSKGAAKTLKARSFFVQVISANCVELIKKKFEPKEIFESNESQNVRIHYNGGGNFYLFLKASDDILEGKLKEIKNIINEQFHKEEIYLSLSSIKLDKGWANSPDNVWKSIHEKANKDKLNKFAGFNELFDTYESDYERNKDRYDWKKVTTSLVNSKGWQTIPEPKNTGIEVKVKEITLLNTKYELVKVNTVEENSFKGVISNEIPVWNDNLLKKYEAEIKEWKDDNSNDKNEIDKGKVIFFDHFAMMAKKRTGSNYLGILKMDVDDLGSVFGSIKDFEQNRKVSKAFKWFFERHLLTILKDNDCFSFRQQDDLGNWNKVSESYYDNAYAVFAGGDDSFILGAWDAIFQLALQIRQEFKIFIDKLFKEMPELKETVVSLYENREITKETISLSAGLTMVGPHFPINRFADDAEDLLDDAKEYNLKKDKINIWGYVLHWDEYEEALKIAKDLAILINEKEEPRGILFKVQQFAYEFEQLEKEGKNTVAIPKVWKLYHALRNVKNKEEIEEIIVKKYSKILIKAFMDKEYMTKANLFNVAVRMAELLTKSKPN